MASASTLESIRSRLQKSLPSDQASASPVRRDDAVARCQRLKHLATPFMLIFNGKHLPVSRSCQQTICHVRNSICCNKQNVYMVLSPVSCTKHAPRPRSLSLSFAYLFNHSVVQWVISVDFICIDLCFVFLFFFLVFTCPFPSFFLLSFVL